MSLTAEQQKRMEESRKKALALRANRLKEAVPKAGSSQPNLPSVAHPTLLHSVPRPTTSLIHQPILVHHVPYATAVLVNPTASIKSNNPVGVISTTVQPTKTYDADDVAAKRFKPSTSTTTMDKSAGQQASFFNKRPGGNVAPVVNNKLSSGATNSKPSFASSKETIVPARCILVSPQRFVVEARYFTPLIEIFKSVNSRQYDTQTKHWSFELSDYDTLVGQMKKLGADSVKIDEIPRYVLSMFGERRAEQNKKLCRVIPPADMSTIDDKLRETLLPFQVEAVNMAVHRGGRLLIADDMGLGKTLEALAIAAYYRQEWPLLIVSPSSVQFAWRQHILDWLPSLGTNDVTVVKSSSSLRSGTGQSECSVFILSYDIMTKCQTELLAKNIRVVIMDESHLLKNLKTARTKKALPILKQASRVILLTGTPALSRPSELYAQLSAIDSKFFKFHDFGLRYCSAKQMTYGWDYSGSSNLAELQIIMEERLMIRRLKKDVLTQLPSKYRTMIVLNPDVIKISKSMKSSHTQVLNIKPGMEKRGALLEYFHETGEAKINAVREYVLDLLEADRKFLLFAHHQSVLNAIEEAVKPSYGYVRIDGRTDSEARTAACQSFQNKDSVRIAVLSIQAANAGLNLSTASLVVFAELFWNPGILVQAEDRVHRIGQLNSVHIQYLMAKNTADDYLWPMIQHKLDVLSKAGLSKDDFSEADTRILQQEDSNQPDLLSYFAPLDEDQECSTTSQAVPSATADQHLLKSGHRPKQRTIGKYLVHSSVSEDKKEQVEKTLIEGERTLIEGVKKDIDADIEDLWGDDFGVDYDGMLIKDPSV